MQNMRDPHNFVHLQQNNIMSSSSHTITIPTKQHDGGNCSALNTIFADDDARKPEKVDAFAKYSNNLIRMKTLLLLDDDDDSDSLDYLGSLNEALRYIRVSDHATRNPGDAMKRRKGNDSQPIQGPCDLHRLCIHQHMERRSLPSISGPSQGRL